MGKSTIYIAVSLARLSDAIIDRAQQAQGDADIAPIQTQMRT